MSRQTFVINRERDRVEALSVVALARWGTRVEVKDAKRTLPQNDRMHAMLTQIARQHQHHGFWLTKDDWKLLFLDQLKSEMRLVPNLNGTGFYNLGRSSSDLTVEEMSDMIELIHMFAARHGINLHDPSDGPEESQDGIVRDTPQNALHPNAPRAA